MVITFAKDSLNSRLSIIAAVLKDLAFEVAGLGLLRSCSLKTGCKTEMLHFLGELPLLPAAGIDDNHLHQGTGMRINEVGQQAGVIGFVEEVAADDEIKKTHRRQ